MAEVSIHVNRFLAMRMDLHFKFGSEFFRMIMAESHSYVNQFPCDIAFETHLNSI